MTTLQTVLAGFRFVEVRFGDTLQALAARELGDASRWSEVAAINNLASPYITGDPALAGPSVALAGSLIRVPAPSAIATVDTDPDQVFGSDVLLERGQLAVEDGDLALVSGRANLRQALVGRMQTERGDLMFHAEYGSLVRRLIGAGSGPTRNLLAAEYARAAIEGDDRIASVTQSVAESVGDVISVSVEAQPIVGRTVDVSLTV